MNISTKEDLENVLKSDLFTNWKERIEKQNDYKVHEIDVQSVDYFGKRIGFLKVKANCKNHEGISIPGISFLRGGAVAILMILECEGKEYCLLTQQPRLPIGEFPSLEIPAGMVF
jgi:ADP-sugar diphosphatase